MTAPVIISREDGFCIAHSSHRDSLPEDSIRAVTGSKRNHVTSITRFKPLYPSRVRWTDFPKFSPPSIRFPRFMGGKLLRADQSALLDRIRSQGVLPFVENGHLWDEHTRDYYRCMVAMFQKHHCPDVDVLVLPEWNPESDVSQSWEKADTDAWFAKCGGNFHLHQNYVFNSNAILKPLLSHFIYPSPPLHTRGGNQAWEKMISSARASFSFYRDKGRSDLFDRPLYLQFLIEAARASDQDMKRLYDLVASCFDEIPEESGINLSGFDFGEAIRDGKWVGTGKYASFDLADEIRGILATLIGLNFLEPRHSSERTVECSEQAAFLSDYLHKTNRDPDLPFRFRDATGWIPSSEIERINECLGRFFRKAKVKLNGFGDSDLLPDVVDAPSEVWDF